MLYAIFINVLYGNEEIVKFLGHFYEYNFGFAEKRVSSHDYKNI